MLMFSRGVTFMWPWPHLYAIKGQAAVTAELRIDGRMGGKYSETPLFNSY